MGNSGSRYVELRWERESLGIHRAQDLRSQFPAVKTLQSTQRIRDYDIIELSPNRDGIIPWLHYKDNYNNPQGRDDYYGGKNILQTAVETLLSRDPEACSTQLRYRFSRPNSAGKRDIKTFLSHFMAFTKLSYATDCLFEGPSPVRDDLISAYNHHRGYLKDEANIDQAEKLLIIGDILGYTKILYDFIPIVFGAWKIGFPGNQEFDKVWEQASRLSRNLAGFSRNLKVILRNHYDAPKSYERGQCERYPDIGGPCCVPEHFPQGPRYTPKYHTFGGGRPSYGQSSRVFEETVGENGDYLLEVTATVDDRRRKNFRWDDVELRDAIDYTSQLLNGNRRRHAVPWERLGGNMFNCMRN